MFHQTAAQLMLPTYAVVLLAKTRVCVWSGMILSPVYVHKAGQGTIVNQQLIIVKMLPVKTMGVVHQCSITPAASVNLDLMENFAKQI